MLSITIDAHTLKLKINTSMGSTVYVKPQSFSLISGASTSPPLSPRTFGIIRSEFLSSSARHTVRLPRERWKKLLSKSQSHYYKLLFNSSIEPQPILVAIATVSAVTVVCFSYSRKKVNIKQMPGRLTSGLPEQAARTLMSKAHTDPRHEELRTKEFVDMEETREIVRAVNDPTNDENKFMETNLITGGEQLIVVASDQSHENSTSQASGTMEISSVLDPDRLRDGSGSPDSKEKELNPACQLRVYNQLIKEGRLSECLEVLHDLEEKGLLAMDKVYHVRFFEVCKNQKAVKEAFRFTKFIPHPTLSTFNMLTSVCASSKDPKGAFQVLRHVEESGLKADCKLYTTLISTCAKSGKVDTMFEVFHEMVNSGLEPNLHTYGAIIDGCGKAGQIAKAFGAYGILRSKNVTPDRVIFNALISACGQSGALDRAFDVLADMRSGTQPIDPDHVTVGALMKACASAGQVDRAREVYNMIHEYNIHGTAELYTIAVNSCSHRGDREFACRVFDDMIRKGVAQDEMFISSLIDVDGHAGRVDAAFDVLQEAKSKGMHIGIVSYSSLMGACSNAGGWQKALSLYKEIKSLNLKPTVPMMNALITALCNADQLLKAMETLFEMKGIGLCPNIITYSILVVASEKKDDLEAGLILISEAKKDGVTPNIVMCRCLIAMCFRRFQTASTFGEQVLSFTSGPVQLSSKWTSLALMVYRETLASDVAPTMDELSLVLGCLQLPHDVLIRNRLIDNLGVNIGTSRGSNIISLIDGFGEYDPRAFYLVEEAASLGVIPLVSFKESSIVFDTRDFQIHTAEMYLLTILKALKHRLAAGAKLPNVIILMPIEQTQIQTSTGEKVVNIAGRIGQAVAALLRRLCLSYEGNESYGKILISGVTIRKWFQPKLNSNFREKTRDLDSSPGRLGSGISRQQFRIRTDHWSME